MSTVLPPQTWAKVKAFLEAKHTGQIVLEVKDGRVLKWRLTECGSESEAPIARPLARMLESDQ